MINRFFSLSKTSTLYYYIDQYPLILPTFISLSFFTFIFYYLTPYKIRLTDGLMGATIFTGLFYLLKTGSWIYLHYFGNDFQQLFGVYAPIMMSIVWTFLIFNCMFVSASITLSPGHRRAKINK